MRDAAPVSPDRRQRALDTYLRACRDVPTLAEALATAADMTSLGRCLREYAARHAACQALFLALPGADRTERHCAYAWIDGFEEAVACMPRLPVDESVDSGALNAGEVVVVEEHPGACSPGRRWPGRSAATERLQARSSIVVPLRGKAHVVATLELRAAGPGTYTPEIAASLRMASATMGVAVERLASGCLEEGSPARNPVLTMDTCGVVVDCNAAALEMIGLPRERIVGRPIEDAILPRSVGEARRFLPAAEAAVAGDAQRILYIDDDEADIELFTRMMERAGHRVQGYVDTQAALATLSERPGDFDLVVTDYHMPRMSGLQVADAVRRISGRVPVAIASSAVSRELRERARRAGIRAVFSKRNPLADLPGLILAAG